MKKILIVGLVCLINISTVPTFAKENKNLDNSTSTCAIVDATEVGEYKNDKGNTVVVFEDGIEVEYQSDGVIIVRDKENLLGTNLDSLSDAKTRSIWVLLGKIAFGIWATYESCSTIQYAADGTDLCRIAISYLKRPAPNTTYAVHAFRTATHVPGCYPSSSSQCIIYGVEYRFVIMN